MGTGGKIAAGLAGVAALVLGFVVVRRMTSGAAGANATQAGQAAQAEVAPSTAVVTQAPNERPKGIGAFTAEGRARTRELVKSGWRPPPPITAKQAYHPPVPVTRDTPAPPAGYDRGANLSEYAETGNRGGYDRGSNYR